MLNKIQRARLRQPKKRTGLFFLLIQLLSVILSLVFFVLVILIGEKSFLINSSWDRVSKICVAILAAILAFGFFGLVIKDIKDSLKNIFGVLLVFLLSLGAGSVIGVLLISLSSIATTQYIGEPAQYRGVAKRIYSATSRGCQHYLNIKIENMGGSICISQSTYEQLTDEPFEVSLKGQKSQYGMIVQGWEY